MFKVTWVLKSDCSLIAASTLQFLPKKGEKIRFGGVPPLYTITDVVYDLPTGQFGNTDVTIFLC